MCWIRGARSKGTLRTYPSLRVPTQMMQYSQPDTYNAVRDLARRMMSVTQVHYDAMLRMMKYVDDMHDRGLVLNLTRKGDGNKEHKFIISD